MKSNIEFIRINNGCSNNKNDGHSAEVEELSVFASYVVKQHFDPIIGPAQNNYMIERFQSPAAIAAQLRRGYQYYWVIFEGKRAGFLAFYPRREDLYLSKFYVEQNFRGRHLARQMLAFLIRQAAAEKRPAIVLNVNRHNTETIAIYLHLGFIIAGEEKQDIGQGYYMDDYVMEYRL